MSSGYGDHTDLDSLFGDDESCDEREKENGNKHRLVISFPRVAVTSQNVGTIAHSPVPSSSEHPHSSGPMSSASIPFTSNSVDSCSQSVGRGKRNTSPQLEQPNKKRRVESNGSTVGFHSQTAGQSSNTSGICTSMEHTLTADAVQAALSLLAPRIGSSHKRTGISKGSRKIVSATAPGILGTGSANDPVIIPDEPPMPNPRPIPKSPYHGTSSKSSSQQLTRRVTRSQEAHALLEALPMDPNDILSQTLRTILKTPTTIPHSRNSAPRDIAVYLANGRHTGTPFLRLLRHLVGSTRHSNPKIGLEMLKKLVEAMRTMEESASKSTIACQSSAASTPMPTTPRTPSAFSFPVTEGSELFGPSNQAFEPALFAPPEFAFESSATSFGGLGDLNKQLPTDVAIDPQLLAISQDPDHLQTTTDNLHDLDLEGLLDALPPPSSSVPGLDSPICIEGLTEQMDAADFPAWDESSSISLSSLFDSWLPAPTELIPIPPLIQPVATTQFVRSSGRPTAQVLQRVPKQSDLPPGGIRIPARTEAQTLLERARARKIEIEAKIKIARRQTWACMVEAGVERNLLGKLQEDTACNTFNG